jgi:hypothetical protein
MPREKADALLKDEVHDQFLFEVGFGLAVLGTEIPIGRLQGILRDVTVTYEDGEAPGMVDVVLRPGSEGVAHPAFELVRDDAPRMSPA